MSTFEDRQGVEREQAPTPQRGTHKNPAPSGCSPQVTILLCTFNGARFLPAQLASIERQTHGNWRLIVSDDGSTDDTLAIVEHFADRVSQPVELRSGPRRGPAANFLALATDPAIEGDVFAFSDQDDVWHPNKLSRAVAWVDAQPEEIPSVYGGRTRLVREKGRGFGHSSIFRQPPRFANAITQNIAGANTMLFNRSMKRLMEKAGPVEVVSHDWWAYQLVTGAGGRFHYDREPQVDYRQHGNNRIGANRGLRAQVHRLRMLFDGRFAHWNTINLAALQASRHLLTPASASLLDAFADMRSPKLATRLKAYTTSGIRRQTLIGNIALLVGVILRKV